MSFLVLQVKSDICRESGPYTPTSTTTSGHCDDEEEWYRHHLVPVMEGWGGCEGGHLMIDLGAYSGDTTAKFYREAEGE